MKKEWTSPIPEAIAKDKSISFAAFRLWVILTTYARHETTCHPSVSTLADDMGCSTTYISTLKKELKDAGYLTWTQNATDNLLTSNTYLLIKHNPIQQSTETRKKVVKETTNLDPEITTFRNEWKEYYESKIPPIVITEDNKIKIKYKDSTKAFEAFKKLLPYKDAVLKYWWDYVRWGNDKWLTKEDVRKVCDYSIICVAQVERSFISWCRNKGYNPNTNPLSPIYIKPGVEE